MQPKPIYESEHDRKMQAEIAAEVARCWGLSATYRLGYNQVLDFLLEKKTGTWGFLEAKDRANLRFGFGDRDGYLFSITKLIRAYLLHETLDLPSWLAVRDMDRAIWTAPLGCHRRGQLKWFGRSSFVAKQEQDHEPGVIMPWSAFTLLELEPPE